MEKPRHQILVCASFRVDGEAKGMCNKKGSASFLAYIESGILDRGMDAMVTATGCMKACDHGPVVVVQPGNIWYGGVDSEEAIDEILDAVEGGETAEKYLLT